MAECYFLGLDLGQASEPTALAVVERLIVPPGAAHDLRRPVQSLRHLQRFPPGTPYPEIIATVRQMLRTRPLIGATLIVDRTGVGQAVLNLFTDGLRNQATCSYLAVTIGSGTDPTIGEGGIQVPRKELVSVLQVLLQTRRLQIPRSLPDAALLVDEMMKFKAKITSAKDSTLESWREGPHDDLVLAVGLAAWQSEKTLPPLVDPPRPWPTRVRV
jgi:hypothetical protein